MIKFVVDSTADLPPELLQRYQIVVLPLSIHFGTEAFKEGVDLDQRSFYHKVETTRTIPKTSQPAPGEFIQLYRRIASPSDTIISMHVGAKLSGTCHSAEVAAQEVAAEFKVHVFDSMCTSAALGFMALEAARMAEAGESPESILARLAAIRPRVNIFFTPATLKYLQWSGRVSNVQALIGSALNMKPIIKLDNGFFIPAARIRTRSKAIDQMLAMTAEKVGDKPINLGIVHAETQGEADELLRRAQQLFNIKESFVQPMATTIAVHAGPGCLGIISYVV